MYTDVLYEVDQGVATITINRPQRLNALSPHSLDEMADAIERATADRAVGVIVITGAGTKAFCAGGDLGEVAGNNDEGDTSDMGKREVLRWVNSFRQATKPVIAKVRGYCIGLGNELNLLCDLTIAGTSAQFGQAGPRVGSVPMVGGTQLLPLVCGFKRAKEVLFLCRRYSGQAAVEIGLANVVVDDEQLDAEVERWVDELLEKSPQSLRLGKLSLSYLFDMQWPSLQHGIELTGWMVRSSEMQEGAAAFMDKRKPNFRPTIRRGPAAQSEAIIHAHIDALLGGDLDTVMADYHPDVVMVAGGHEVRGAAAVRQHLADALASAPEESQFDYKLDTGVDGIITMTWLLMVPERTEPAMVGVDTFEMEQQRIVRQTVVSTRRRRRPSASPRKRCSPAHDNDHDGTTDRQRGQQDPRHTKVAERSDAGCGAEHGHNQRNPGGIAQLKKGAVRRRGQGQVL